MVNVVNVAAVDNRVSVMLHFSLRAFAVRRYISFRNRSPEFSVNIVNSHGASESLLLAVHDGCSSREEFPFKSLLLYRIQRLHFIEDPTLITTGERAVGRSHSR